MLALSELLIVSYGFFSPSEGEWNRIRHDDEDSDTDQGRIPVSEP